MINSRQARRACITLGALLAVSAIVSILWHLRNWREMPGYTAVGQWGGGSCVSVDASDGYRWGEETADGYIPLFRGPFQIGGFFLSGQHAGKYLSLSSNGWDLRPCEPPIAPPAGSTGQVTGSNFGLDVAKLDPGNSPQYRLGNSPISRERAFQEIGADQSLPNYASKRRIVVIGSEAERKQARQVIEAMNPGDGYLIEDFAPNDWQVARGGFVVSGRPTVYCLEPDGKVLFRQDDLSGLKLNMESVRKPDPNYDPSRDPDRRVMPGGGVETMAAIAAVVLVLVGLGAHRNRMVQADA